MTKSKIIVSCTFREFDGSENDRIQRLFLESIKNQTFKGITLAVTNFREKTVKKVIEDCGVDFRFFQSEMDLKFYSISETCYNAASLLTPGDSILLHTSADHIFPPQFFEIVANRMLPGGSVTSFPQRIFDGVEAHQNGKSIEDGGDQLRLNRGMLEGIDDGDLPGLFRMDPNHWLPDTVAVDGDLFLEPGARERLMTLAQRDASPGVAQNTLLAFLAKPGKRRNIVFEARYDELLNDYATDPLSVEGAETYQQIRANQYHQAEENWKNLNAYAEDIGLQPHEYRDQPFLKIDQLMQYDITGSHEQKVAFRTYLEFWRLRYLMRMHSVEKTDLSLGAVDRMKQSVALLMQIPQPQPIEFLSYYQKLWVFGAGQLSELTLDVLTSQGLEVQGVADSYQTGEFQGFDLLSPETLSNMSGANDGIVIASMHWREIADTLRSFGVEADLMFVNDTLAYGEPPAFRKLPRAS